MLDQTARPNRSVPLLLSCSGHQRMALASNRRRKPFEQPFAIAANLLRTATGARLALLVVDMDAASSYPPNGRWTLKCRVCGRTSVADTDELLKFVTDGWPRCCGEVMAVLVEPTDEADLSTRSAS
jgi:hypothetical protein